MSILKFLNDNIGLITLIVGFSAIYLYLKQKADTKRDIAKLILQEIKYAEQQIRNSGRGSRGYSLSSRLLPTNSWDDNIHLFITDMKETEIDMISEFFSQAAYIDYLIEERSKQKLNQKFSLRPIAIGQQATTTPTDDTPQQQPTPQQIAQIIQEPNFNEQITINLLTDFSSKIEFLYNTPAAEKMRQLSERKWYQPF